MAKAVRVYTGGAWQSNASNGSSAVVVTPSKTSDGKAETRQ